ncbi:SDR family oxidoreductase [Mycobacterium sp. GA-2829]|uniref:SDR family oxidoreductase n=1 Tax=Mycobacterium sp. GA-2829 TaxID=1772283 RepID=UPI00350FC32A
MSNTRGQVPAVDGRDRWQRRGLFHRCQRRLAPRHLGNPAGSPDDIADAITFLVSERAGYVNGVLFNVDGGSEYL